MTISFAVLAATLPLLWIGDLLPHSALLAVLGTASVESALLVLTAAFDGYRWLLSR